MAPPYLGLNAEPLIEEHRRSMTGSIRIVSVRPSQISVLDPTDAEHFKEAYWHDELVGAH